MKTDPTYEELLKRVRELEDGLSSNNKGILNTIFKATPDILVLKDTDSVYKMVNPAFCSLVGRPEDEIIGKTDFDLFPEAEAEMYFRDDKKVITTLKQKVQDEETSGKEGKKWLRVAKTPLLDDEGACTGVLCTVSDISEQKKIEEECRSSLKYLENMRKVSQVIQQATDLDRMMIDTLDQILSIFDCDRAFLLYSCDPDALTWSVPMARNRPEYPGLAPADNIPITPDVINVFKAALETREPVTFDPTNNRHIPLGDEFSIQSQIIMAIYPGTGKPWLIGAHQCSHKRVWSEDDTRLFKDIGNRITDALSNLLLVNDLKRSENRFRSLIQTAPIVIMHITSDHRIVEFNKEAEELYGKKREDVIGKDYFKLFLPEKEWERVSSDIKKVLSGQPTIGYLSEVIDKDGNKRIIFWNIDSLLESDGRATGIIAVGVDVTTRVESEEKIKSSEKKYKSLLESVKSEYFFYSHGTDGVFTFLSPSVTDILGYTEEEFKTHYSEYMTDSPINEKVEYHTQQSIKGIRQPSYHVEIHHKYGDKCLLEVLEAPVMNENGDVIAVDGAAHDVTERERAKEAQRKSDERLRVLLETIPHAVYECNTDGLITVVNRAYSKIIGYSRDELLKMHIWDMIAESEQKETLPGYLKYLIDEQPTPTPYFNKAVRKDGRVIDVQVDWTYKRDDKGDVTGFVCILSDITERKLAEEQKRRDYLNRMGIMVIALNKDGKVGFINKKGCDILGYEMEDVIGKDWFTNFLPKRINKEVSGIFKKLMTGEEEIIPVYENRVVNKDGKERIILWNNTILKDETGIMGVLSSGEDITDKKYAEKRVKSSEDKYRLLFNSANDAIFIVKVDGEEMHFVDCNISALEMLGLKREDLIGKTPLDISPPVQPSGRSSREMAIEFNAAAMQGVPQNFDWTSQKSDGTEIFMEASISRIDIGGEALLQAILRDVTEKRKAEEERQSLWNQFVQVQKLDSMGRLTGGLAHDFNNILQTTIGFSNLAYDMLPDNSPVKEMLEKINQSSLKASSLISKMLAFSRNQVLEFNALNINTIINNFIEMASRLLGEDVTLIKGLEPHLKNIMADDTQIEQVLMNLFINARHAMPKGGELTVETKNVFIDERLARSLADVSPGEYIQLSVIDTGLGITKEVQERIFEPFFTTKENGHGTGLGLSTVYGIIKQHNGYIQVESEPDRGAEFKIFFPVASKAADEAAASDIYQLKKGSETILVVEDASDVRFFFVRALESLGYEVLDAENGEEALEIVQQYKDKIDILLTDVVMTGINGFELYERIKKERPDIKVIFLSGFIENPVVLNKIQKNKLPFLRKPIEQVKLSSKIREVLDIT
jgi:PAS domain S-box-containing protein